MRNSKIVLFDNNPGRTAQTVGIARELGTEADLIHEPSVGVVGNKGDSQCYLGVQRKVEVIHECLRQKIGHDSDQMSLRLVQPEYTVATSDGMRNGTREMRYSLIGREVTHDTLCEHLSASGLEGTIAVVACDKPPVGTLSALLEHDRPSIIMSDGPIRPGTDSVTKERIDIITGFQAAGSNDEEMKKRVAFEACPGYGSCGGMFTYNTMQTFIAVVGMEPLHMVSPPSDDPRRMEQFPNELVTYLEAMMEADLTPRKIVSRDSIRNAMIVAMAVGGSTNVLLHGPEIARAAGFGNFAEDIMSFEEFNHLSHNVVPVLVDVRPFGAYSMVDIDEQGGIQVIVKELLDAGLLNGDTLTCTGETLSQQVARLNPPAPDGEVIYSVANPYKPTGGLRVLGGNLSPDYSAVLKLAGVEGGLEGNVFVGKARIFDSESDLLLALENQPDVIENHDMIIVRYEGPSGAPGMPEMLDSTSRITTLCREKDIVVGLMTDARFSGGSVGLVIGHVGPEAALGGPIAFVENGDEIVVDLNTNELNCTALSDHGTLDARKTAWDKVVEANGGTHPSIGNADTRLLNRMRRSAVSAVYGAGMHPDRVLWVKNQREPVKTSFVPSNKYRAESRKAF
ncbi:MAG: dihydroxy-acid dehydratase [Rhodospirillaceae bacterium]|nr:dihydroxy-acid dehydratase [Rhodospirillaceae bacterium]MBT4042707.1 dihydroxy-acid dehydratase [Rhodospirillaceae bacterium]MBT4686607.1 dihydroxy-acid dehydratase [Rhodospirillaceae bacterium]MBT5081616.1 dihydroxy-acid dehydratase [Rhodospirillaceae bacterium]MBT5524868.1 dihydroxy-acid dehydratase [Rhodospirillaceae bacterium]